MADGFDRCQHAVVFRHVCQSAPVGLVGVSRKATSNQLKDPPLRIGMRFDAPLGPSAQHHAEAQGELRDFLLLLSRRTSRQSRVDCRRPGSG